MADRDYRRDEERYRDRDRGWDQNMSRGGARVDMERRSAAAGKGAATVEGSDRGSEESRWGDGQGQGSRDSGRRPERRWERGSGGGEDWGRGGGSSQHGSERSRARDSTVAVPTPGAARIYGSGSRRRRLCPGRQRLRRWRLRPHRRRLQRPVRQRLLRWRLPAAAASRASRVRLRQRRHLRQQLWRRLLERRLLRRRPMLHRRFLDGGYGGSNSVPATWAARRQARASRARTAAAARRAISARTTASARTSATC